MKNLEGKRRLRVRVMFLLFYAKLALLTHDVTCSRLYLEKKVYEDAMSDEHLRTHAS